MLFSIHALKKVICILIIGGMSTGFWSAIAPESHAQEPASSPETQLEANDTPDGVEGAGEGPSVSASSAVTSPLTSTVTTAPVTELSETITTTTSTETVAPVMELNTQTITPTVASTATTTALAALDDEIVEFSELGFTEQTLRGPYQTRNFRFRTPADWELIPEAKVKLRIITLFGGLDTLEASEIVPETIGTLEISFNNHVLSNLVLDVLGERTVTFDIPTTALAASREDGRHDLKITLDSSLNCRSDFQTTLIVQPTSNFILPHEVVEPTTDLRLLPRPIHQDSFIPDSAVIVTPDKPSVAELRAAMTVAAGFGRMSFGKLNISLIPANQLSDEMQETHHLIFVGNPKAFSILGDVALPAPLNGGSFKATGAAPEDGIIQMAVSPWHPARVVLVVSGASDEAIVKAAQAVSSGTVRVTGQPNLALVAEIQAVEPEQTVEVVAIDRTLADLGYSALTREGRGTEWFEYLFEVPAGYTADVESYVEVVFNHSARLNIEQSGLNVRLNNELIGNVSFSEATSSISRTRFAIPRFALRSGTNRLTIQSELVPLSDCVDTEIAEVWVTIWPDSAIHLPLIPLQGGGSRLFYLDDYPEPFILDASLGNTAFVLPAADPVAWDVAAQLAADLGNRASSPLVELEVVTGETLPEEIRQNRHLLLVGQPSKLPLVAELDEALPGPFEPGSDVAQERSMRVIYRLPAKTSVGYLESLPAPWNRGQMIVAVLGNDAQGLRWAAAALTMPHLRYKLEGNFLVVQGEQIVAGSRELGPEPQFYTTVANEEDTAQPAEAPPGEALAAEAGEPPLTSEVAAASSSGATAVARKPSWIAPLLGLSTTLMVMIIGVVVVSSWRQQRRPD